MTTQGTTRQQACPWCGSKVTATYDAAWEVWRISEHEAECERAPWRSPLSRMDSEIGDRNRCRYCLQGITFTGGQWLHDDTAAEICDPVEDTYATPNDVKEVTR